MRRRRFVATLASWTATLADATARAQARLRVAVLLVAFDESAPGVMLFRDRLQSLGHADGRGVELMFVVAEGPAQLPRRAAEIVALRPDIIVALHAVAVDALRARTSAIAIVVAFCGNPVALGYSASWSRPTGNVTGILDGLDTLAGKRVEHRAELVLRLLQSSQASSLLG
jgi:putative ABC transport system substrate-binding protein